MKFRPLIISLVFFCLWSYVGFNIALLNSPTFDEPVHAKAGKLYQQGDYNFDPIEPPLVRRFVTIASQTLQLSDRNIVTLSTGLLAAILVYYLGTVSIFAGWLGALLFLAEPNLIAHSSLFTTDAISAFLSVIASLLILKEFWKKPLHLTILSLFFALSASAKISTLSLLLPLLLIKFPRLGFGRLFTLVLTSSFIVWGTYNFNLDLPFRGFPLPIPLGGYLRALKENIQFAHRGQPLFFWEHLYVTGPALKQILVSVLKTPLLQLCLFIFSGQYLLPLFLIFLVNTFVGLHFGIRHLLTAEIFIILSVSQVKLRRYSLKILIFLVAILQFASVYGHLPQFITYANPLAGKTPYRIFTDSDFDWGQGLISLRSSLNRQGIEVYQLAYFGNVNPRDYLGDYLRIKDSNPIDTHPITPYNPKLPAIISITCYYQCGYYQNPQFSLNKSEVIAQSFLIFRPND